jgi:hypothetical protein
LPPQSTRRCPSPRPASVATRSSAPSPMATAERRTRLGSDGTGTGASVSTGFRQTRMLIGFSIAALKAASSSAPRTPSTTR